MVTPSLKAKKKRWVTILAPKILNERPIGESYVADPDLLIGRVISCNLMTLTNDMKTQNITMKFIVSEIKDGKAHTKPVGYSLNQTYLKRMMRRGKNRIDESYHLKTADDRGIRIKLFLLTNSVAKSSVVKVIRNKLKEQVTGIVEKNKYDDIFDGVISHKIQREIRAIINKMFPLKACEIKALKEEKIKTTVKKEVKEIEKIKKEEKTEESKEEKQPEQKEKKKEEEKKEIKKEKETKKKNAKASN